MKYLCLAYYNEQKFDTLSQSEMEAIGRECQPYDEELRKSGHLLTVGALQHRATTTLRPKSGQTTVVDGPFVETKEQVGAFFLIEAKDLNEAIRVASMHPAAHFGEELGWAIEVRPIEFFDQP